MRINLVKSIGAAVGVASILFLFASPAVSAASINCAKRYAASLCQEGAMVPQHFSHCVLTTTTEVVQPVRPSNKLSPDERVFLSFSPINVILESHSNEGIAIQGDIVQASPPKPRIQYHCRNYLNSEEFPL